MDIRWSPMVALSVVLHLAIFSVVLFVPEAMPTRRFEGVVYSVNLVEMPAGAAVPSKGTRTGAVKKGKRVAKKASRAERIRVQKKKKKPVVIAKRTVETKKPTIEKPRVSSSELIDRAVSKIEKKVKSEEENHVEEAISRLESEVGTPAGPSPQGGSPVGAIPMQMYQMEVEDRIKGNWSYPVALQSKEDLEAIVVVTVKRDGSILKTEMKKGSSDAIFDDSVLRAVKRSDPLPPFPEGYRESYDEIEIRFNLQDLQDS
ncbi:MAG: TonB family protein [Desulfobacteraceae bacterium]|jgi:colicin import membrane protein